MINSSIYTDLSTMDSVRAKVELYNGSTLVQECTCSDYLQDFAIKREGERSKFFGFGICQALELHLIDIDGTLSDRLSDNITIKICYSNEDLIYWDCPYPTFYTDRLMIDKKNSSITITAFDKVKDLVKYTLADVGIQAPYTVKQLYYAVGGKVFNTVTDTMGDAGTYPNFYLLYEKGGNYEGTETLRDVLNHIAEITGSVYFVTTNGALTLKPLVTRTISVNKEYYYELIVSTPKTLTAVCHSTELGDNYTVSAEENNGVTQYIRNNPLIEMRTDIPTVLNSIFDIVFLTTFQQYELDWSGDYRLEPWDVFEVETDDGSYIDCVVINDSISFSGVIGEVTTWEYSETDTGTESNPTTLKDILDQTYARVDKLNKEITLYAGQVESTIEDKVTSKVEEKAAELIIDVDSIEQRVTEVEKVTSDIDGVITEKVTQQVGEITTEVDKINASVESITQTTKEHSDTLDEQGAQLVELTKRVDATITDEEFEIKITEVLAEGVDKVTTVTGFTFDSDGLHIKKSESEMNSTLDEDGLVVSRFDDPVLTAKSEGVNALNITVRQYFTIGGSRFEKYKHDRTGCYWIGD